jgi:hypothetical protein
MISKTAICSPTPKLPSLAPVVHFSPHCVPVVPAVHVFAAAVAELASLVMIVSWVKGASSAVAANQRVKYALNERWSILHLLASQADKENLGVSMSLLYVLGVHVQHNAERKKTATEIGPRELETYAHT